MTIARLIVTVRDYQGRMSPEQARAATDERADGTVLMFTGGLIVGTLSADALWAYAVSDKPAEQADADPVAFVRKAAPPPAKPKRRTKAAQAPAPPPVIDAEPTARIPEPAASPTAPPSTPAKRGRPRGSTRAHSFLQKQLAHGPQPEVLIEAAAEAEDISETALIAAADALGVRTQRGRWWLPGVLDTTVDTL